MFATTFPTKRERLDSERLGLPRIWMKFWRNKTSRPVKVWCCNFVNSCCLGQGYLYFGFPAHVWLHADGYGQPDLRVSSRKYFSGCDAYRGLVFVAACKRLAKQRSVSSERCRVFISVALPMVYSTKACLNSLIHLSFLFKWPLYPIKKID